MASTEKDHGLIGKVTASGDGETPQTDDAGSFADFERAYEAEIATAVAPASAMAGSTAVASLCEAGCRHYFEMTSQGGLVVADPEAPSGKRLARIATRRCLVAPGVSLDAVVDGDGVSDSVRSALADPLIVFTCRHYNPWDDDEIKELERRRQLAAELAAGRRRIQELINDRPSLVPKAERPDPDYPDPERLDNEGE